MNKKEEKISSYELQINRISNENSKWSEKVDYLISELDNKEKIIENLNEFNINHQTGIESLNTQYEDEITS